MPQEIVGWTRVTSAFTTSPPTYVLRPSPVVTLSTFVRDVTGMQEIDARVQFLFNYASGESAAFAVLKYLQLGGFIDGVEYYEKNRELETINEACVPNAPSFALLEGHKLIFGAEQDNERYVFDRAVTETPTVTLSSHHMDAIRDVQHQAEASGHINPGYGSRPAQPDPHYEERKQMLREMEVEWVDPITRIEAMLANSLPSGTSHALFERDRSGKPKLVLELPNDIPFDRNCEILHSAIEAVAMWHKTTTAVVLERIGHGLRRQSEE